MTDLRNNKFTDTLMQIDYDYEQSAAMLTGISQNDNKTFNLPRSLCWRLNSVI